MDRNRIDVLSSLYLVLSSLFRPATRFVPFNRRSFRLARALVRPTYGTFNRTLNLSQPGAQVRELNGVF